MPMYEYACGKCGETFTMLRSMGAGADGLSCPACGGKKVKKLISSTYTPDPERGMPSAGAQERAFAQMKKDTLSSPCASGACGGGSCSIKEFKGGD